MSNEAKEVVRHEMDDNTLYAKNVKVVTGFIATVIISCWMINSVVKWHEINQKTEITKMEISPEGVEHARLARDRAMFESVPKK